MKKEFLVSGKQFFVNETVPLVAGDSNCYELVFYAPCDLSNSVFTVTATRSDGEIFTGLGNVSGKTARYVLGNDMYAVTGPLKVRTTITDGEGREITANEITFEVIEGTNSDDAVKADTNYPVLTQLVLKVQDIVNSVPEVKTVIGKAENAAEIAETKAIFANAEGEKAKKAAEDAENAADRALRLAEKIESVENALPPTFSDTDKGKILYLSKNSFVSELVSASRSYSFDDAVILDAGLLDEERAFIDISGAEILDIGIKDPMDERCAFGFQLMPDSIDYTTDYDITVENTEETDEGIRMIFPAEHCEPFAENNIQSASDLFAIFERVQFNSDFPENCVVPVWGTPEEILPASFLDESIISPSVRLANEYTDNALVKFNFTEDKNAVYSYSFAKNSFEIGEENVLWYGIYYDEQQNKTHFTLVVPIGLYFEMQRLNAVFYNPNTGNKLICEWTGQMMDGDKGELTYTIDGQLEEMTKEEFAQAYTHFGEYDGRYVWKSEEELLKPMKNYTDSKINEAIIDSWEVAV